MAEEPASSPGKHETLLEKLAEELEDEKVTHPQPSAPPTPYPRPGGAKLPVQPTRLFGRQQPIHQVLGGGKPADVFLWRDRNVSAAIFAGVTAIWVIFQLLGYHLLTFISHALIFTLGLLFLWSNASSFINKTPARIPEVNIPEDLVVGVALSIRNEINRAFVLLRSIASGHELKKFLLVIFGLWFISVLGTWFSFLTLFYCIFVLLHTVPVAYEKYEDQVDAFGERALHEIKKQFAVLNANVLSKIPRGPLKDKTN